MSVRHRLVTRFPSHVAHPTLDTGIIYVSALYDLFIYYLVTLAGKAQRPRPPCRVVDGANSAAGTLLQPIYKMLSSVTDSYLDGWLRKMFSRI